MKKYTKADLEVLLLSQSATIDLAREQLWLLSAQNERLLEENHQLKTALQEAKASRKLNPNV